MLPSEMQTAFQIFTAAGMYSNLGNLSLSVESSHPMMNYPCLIAGDTSIRAEGSLAKFLGDRVDEYILKLCRIVSTQPFLVKRLLNEDEDTK